MAAKNLYTRPDQAEPWLPREGARDAVLAQAHRLQVQAMDLRGQTGAAMVQAMSPRLRAMNSYYTNKIEGQHTLPSEIDDALAKDFSAQPEVSRRQRMAVAHMATEQWAEEQLSDLPWPELFAPDLIAALHRHLFAQLPDDDRRLVDGSVMVPGEWRRTQVRVGEHEAPDAAALPAFMQRFAQVYGGVRPGEMALVATACAHHRLAWIHPFADGNGRVARLHSHLLLHAQGLTLGLWSPLRGLARTQQDYYKALAQADMPRHGDLDGRGNLSEQRLLEFVRYFLAVCADQVQFMTPLLATDALRLRLRAALMFESTLPTHPNVGTAELAMQHLWAVGELSRGDFKRLVQASGVSARQAETVLAHLLARGLLLSSGPRSAVRFGLPLHVLRFLFPALWPEAEAQALT